MANNLKTLNHYINYLREFDKLSHDEMSGIARHMCRTDLFFLLWWGCGRRDIFKQWLLDRCKEVEANPNGYLDLWSREHYKSTIITFGKTIQDILASHGDDPLPEWKGIEPTFGIFSCTRPIAKGFLRQIKREFESNKILKDLFPDVIWENCQKEAPKWSEDDGLVLKRKSNPKESTVEAWGLVDGQPTSKHFFIRVYDDLITIDNVRSPNMIAKTTEAWELSTNLGMDGGYERMVGTRYHFNDSYRSIIARGAAIPRIYPATLDGTPNGEPVLLSKEALQKKRRDQGPYTFSCQMLLNPLADETQGFKRDWVRFYDSTDGSGMNTYICIDPAHAKKKENDYTVMATLGLGPDNNFYLLDIIRDRLNLTQRGDYLFRLHKKWRPLNVFYEQYGMQADINYLQDRMNRENYRFGIQPLAGKLSKSDRIKALIPIFEQHRFYLPNSLFKTNYEGKTEDLIDIFLNEEYDAFPVSVHDDMFDAISRIIHDEQSYIVWPQSYEQPVNDRYSVKRQSNTSAWAA
jgi:predicted phage terminase large subunit-like protein